MQTRAFVALGSNLGDSRALIFEAMERLEALSATPLLRSSLWRSSPVNCPPGSPDFINAVAGLTPLAKNPEEFLVVLQRIEKEFGRRPKAVMNEARPLDLDLIAWGEEIRSSDLLTLPHPRAHLRRFVLAPLEEIAPELTLPGQHRSIRALLAELHTDEIISRLS